jgi:hypothetical protein
MFDGEWGRTVILVFLLCVCVLTAWHWLLEILPPPVLPCIPCYNWENYILQNADFWNLGWQGDLRLTGYRNRERMKMGKPHEWCLVSFTSQNMEVNETTIMIKSWMAPWANRVAGTTETRPCPAGYHTDVTLITAWSLMVPWPINQLILPSPFVINVRQILSYNHVCIGELNLNNQKKQLQSNLRWLTIEKGI